MFDEKGRWDNYKAWNKGINVGNMDAVTTVHGAVGARAKSSLNEVDEHGLPYLPEPIIHAIEAHEKRVLDSDDNVYRAAVRAGRWPASPDRPVALHDALFLRRVQDKTPITFYDLYKHGRDFFCAVDNTLKEGDEFNKKAVRKMIKKAATTERKKGKTIITASDAICKILRLITEQTNEFDVEWEEDQDGLGLFKLVYIIEYRGITVTIEIFDFGHKILTFLDFDPNVYNELYGENEPTLSIRPRSCYGDTGYAVTSGLRDEESWSTQDTATKIIDRLKAAVNDSSLDVLRTIILKLIGKKPFTPICGTHGGMPVEYLFDKNLQLEYEEKFLEYLLTAAFCTPTRNNQSTMLVLDVTI